MSPNCTITVALREGSKQNQLYQLAAFEVSIVCGSMGDWIRQLGKRVFKLDIKGYNRAEDKWARISEGDIDYADVRKALKEINFCGWCAAEVGGGDAAELKRISSEMDTSSHAREQSRLVTTTDAPASASARHIADPRCPQPPVTRATRPVRSNSCWIVGSIALLNSSIDSTFRSGD